MQVFNHQRCHLRMHHDLIHSAFRILTLQLGNQLLRFLSFHDILFCLVTIIYLYPFIFTIVCIPVTVNASNQSSSGETETLDAVLCSGEPPSGFSCLPIEA